MAARYVLKNTSDNQFMFNLLAGNNEPILTSERYTAKASAINGIESVKKHSAADEHYRRETAKDDSPYFVLVAGNGQTIGRSEMYSSTSARENGIASVKKNGPDAPIDDKT